MGFADRGTHRTSVHDRSQVDASSNVVLLRPAQVAEKLGIAPATLATMRVRGGGPNYVKVGSSVKYRSDDIDAFVASLARRAHTSDVTPHNAPRGTRTGSGRRR